MITAALEGKLNDVEFVAHRTFGMMMPKSCPNVPSELLSPRYAWANEDEYDIKAKELGTMFIKNFEKYAAGVNEEILAAAPKVNW
jgi:phosphoenolpyruvate carboxykinase (ATP)